MEFSESAYKLGSLTFFICFGNMTWNSGDRTEGEGKIRNVHTLVMSLRLLEPPVKVERTAGSMGAGQVWSMATTAVRATAVICEVYIVIMVGLIVQRLKLRVGMEFWDD